MKKLILALSITIFSATLLPAQAKDLSGNTRANLQTTRQYYAQLLTGTQPQLAELNMLMTMLPKGGDIHHHYSGAIYAETYLDWVEQQGFCIYRESDASKKQEKFRIEAKPSASLQPNNACIKVDAVRKDNAFYRELLSTWSDKDYDNHGHQQLAPDQHFFNSFGYFSPISKFSNNDGLKILKQRAKAENQQYLETLLKSAPVTDHPEFSAQLDALPADASAPQLQQAFDKLADFLAHDDAAQKKIADYNQELSNDAAGIDDAEFSLRIQSYVSRNSAPSKIFSGLFAAFSASQGNPLIVGVNIVGPENGVVALRDYTLHMQMFAFLKQRFPKVHLSLHAGELALGMVPPEHLSQHIRSAIDLAGAERIGHGVDITHEEQPDQLLADLKRRNVAIEINLSSNAFILGVQQQAHPITVYLRHHIPIVISSDDMGVSRNNLSNEYLLFTSRYKPSYDTLKTVAYNSIRYSFLSPADKVLQLRQLDRRFIKFEAAVAQLAQSARRTP
ncbi:MAG: adenosine deaminase [Pseudomonadota bacterium]